MALDNFQIIRMLHASRSGNAGAQGVGVRKYMLTLVAQPKQFGGSTFYCSFDSSCGSLMTLFDLRALYAEHILNPDTPEAA